MNGAYYHLVVNHLPLIFPIVGMIVLLVGLLSKSEPVKRTGYLIFILGAICSILAMASGEEAEEVVEKIKDIDEKYIKSHEHVAETFAILSYILGAISILGLLVSFTRKKFSNIVAIIAVAFTIVVLFFAKETGTTGGEIRHSEIRPGSASNSSANSENNKYND